MIIAKVSIFIFLKHFSLIPVDLEVYIVFD